MLKLFNTRTHGAVHENEVASLEALNALQSRPAVVPLVAHGRIPDAEIPAIITSLMREGAAIKYSPIPPAYKLSCTI